jgi:TonB family protein
VRTRRIAGSQFLLFLALAGISSAAQPRQNDQSGLNVKRDSSGRIVVPSSSSSSRMFPSQSFAGVEVLTDTQGVDFIPYLQKVISVVRKNWYAAIPVDVHTKKGKMAIEFTVARNGSISHLRLVASSGDTSLDRAAWKGIIASNPLPPLPDGFTGKSITLPFPFSYNPDAAQFDGSSRPTK